MNDLKEESMFFHDISTEVIDLVQNSSNEMTIVEDKGIGDYSTQVDVSVEDLIVGELNKRFPEDQVLAEEGYSNTEIPNSRIWLIDPICGTTNLGKGINNFCTNIALVEEKRVIASCVIDHSRDEYFWSIGNSEVYVNDEPYRPPSKKLGRKIDIDFGSVRSVDNILRQKHNNYLHRLIEETDFDIVSLNTSLGFAYTAIGKTDGFINLFNHPWDIAAASFLVQQAGGVITGIDGSPWSVTTIGAIGGHTPEIHEELLNLFLNS
jgi:myo-inositol-1(or 4)-monophosphatase